MHCSWCPSLLGVASAAHIASLVCSSRGVHQCLCYRDHLWEVALAADGYWCFPEGPSLLMVSTLPGSRTCLGERDHGTHNWAVVPYSHVLAVLKLQRWAQVVRALLAAL